VSKGYRHSPYDLSVRLNWRVVFVNLYEKDESRDKVLCIRALGINDNRESEET
jgi:hypothetical protein